jgi:hypothetical protein
MVNIFNQEPAKLSSLSDTNKRLLMINYGKVLNNKQSLIKKLINRLSIFERSDDFSRS